MEPSQVYDEYIEKLEIKKKELSRYIECAINYEELLDEYEDADSIESGELLFNDATDLRKYELLRRDVFITECVVSIMEEFKSLDEQKKQRHHFNKANEYFIHQLRSFKKESREIIEAEQKSIDEIETVLKLIGEVRK